ncbi:MAG: PHP domain-containing protein [Clostridium lundense]|jgi:hypothetical protein|nr:PHP domain-containing protein [Clostridium lundense]
MKESYFPEKGIWLKGNLHSHSTVSDGQFTPLELASQYAAAGYDFLSMTDHNLFVTHNELPEEKIILLTGVEHDIEYSADRCTHVVGIGDPCKEKTDYLCRRYSAAEKSDQQLIDMMQADGQFVTIAHPVWSRSELDDILALDNYHAIEVFNNGTEHLCHGGNAEVLWDMLLRHGKKVFATACDDVHIPDDLFGGWIIVKAADRSKESIFKALFSGAFYATNGPAILDFGVEDQQIYVSCSECREIHFVTFEPRGRSFFADEGETLTNAHYTLLGRESYVRVVCVDAYGHSAWSNPIFFDDRKT